MEIISDRSICFAPTTNTPRKGKMRRDADHFRRQAKAFMKLHGLSKDRLVLFDNSNPKKKKAMRETILDALDEPLIACALRETKPIVVAFFCHGYKRGIQAGFDLRSVEQLAQAIHDFGGKTSAYPVRVPLYACDTGRDIDRDREDDLREFGGDGGFADELRDSLCEAGSICCRVDGHTTAGRATRNMNVRRFNGDGSPVGGRGGFYPVPRPKRKKPKRNALWRAWCRALKTKFRFQFTFMTTAEIHAYLATKL